MNPFGYKDYERRFEWDHFESLEDGFEFDFPKNLQEELYKLESFPNEQDSNLEEIRQNLIDYSDCDSCISTEDQDTYFILEECNKYLYVFKYKNKFFIISSIDLDLLRKITNTINFL